MFGLAQEEWRDLVLSLNVRRKDRRLLPFEAGRFISKAMMHSDINQVATELGFADTSTIRKIVRIGMLPDDAMQLVSWHGARDSLSMSTAGELLRLFNAEAKCGGLSAQETFNLFREAIEYGLNKEEARQLVQIFKRNEVGWKEALNRTLQSRPKVVRYELVIGSYVSNEALNYIKENSVELAGKKVKRNLAVEHPDLTCIAFRPKKDRFTFYMKADEMDILRSRLTDASIEQYITALLTK